MKARAPIAGLTLVAGLWPWSALHAAGEGSCLDCHRKKTPSHVKVWQASAHARAKVGCAACHGSDHRRIEKGEAYVGAGVCGRCHREAHRSHVSGRHGLSGCTRGGVAREPSPGGRRASAASATTPRARDRSRPCNAGAS